VTWTKEHRMVHQQTLEGPVNGHGLGEMSQASDDIFDIWLP